MKENFHWYVLGFLSFGLLLYMLFPFLDVVVYGIFVYYVARPVYRELKSVTKSDTLRAFISLIVLVLPTIIVIGYTLGIASIELSSFLSTVEIEPVKKLNELLAGFGQFTEDLRPVELIALVGEHEDLGRFLVGLITETAGIIFKIILMLLVAYYLLKDGTRTREWLLNNFCCKDSELSDRFFNSVDANLSNVFFGNILNAGFTATIGAITFSFLNIISPSPFLDIPYPVLAGILCGLASLIPAFGIKLVWVPIFLFLTIQSHLNNVMFENWWFLVLFLVFVNFIVDMIPDIILRPYVSGKELHRGVLLFSYIFGPVVFGITGILIGPMIVVFVTNFMKIILPELRK